MTFEEFESQSEFHRNADIILHGKYLGTKVEDPFFYNLHQLFDFYVIGTFPADGDHRKMLSYKAVQHVPDLDKYERR